MPEYSGPERRYCSDDTASTLAEIRTDVKWLVGALPTLATNERVDGLRRDLDGHVASHITKGGLLASWAGVAVAMAVGVFAIIVK